MRGSRRHFEASGKFERSRRRYRVNLFSLGPLLEVVVVVGVVMSKMETKLCRTCGSLTETYVDVFRTEGLRNKIETCLPIVVSSERNFTVLGLFLRIFYGLEFCLFFFCFEEMLIFSRVENLFAWMCCYFRLFSSLRALCFSMDVVS